MDINTLSMGNNSGHRNRILVEYLARMKGGSLTQPLYGNLKCYCKHILCVPKSASGSWRAMTEICERILAVDTRIGFVMVVNQTGEIVESVMRGTRLMPDDHIATYTGLWTSVIQGICKQMEKFLGSHQFYSLGYDKLTVYGVPVGENTIVITARKDLPLETVLSLREIAETQLQTRT